MFMHIRIPFFPNGLPIAPDNKVQALVTSSLIDLAILAMFYFAFIYPRLRAINTGYYQSPGYALAAPFASHAACVIFFGFVADALALITQPDLFTFWKIGYDIGIERPTAMPLTFFFLTAFGFLFLMNLVLANVFLSWLNKTVKANLGTALLKPGRASIWLALVIAVVTNPLWAILIKIAGTQPYIGA